MAENLPRGWLSADEAAELQRIAAGKTVLELGAWKGRSTVVLAQVAGYVVSVDIHRGISIIPDSGESLTDYLANVRDLPNVAIVVAKFEQFVPLLREVAFDLVYIDGDHDRDSVSRDTRLAIDLEAETIAFHDWGEPGVIAGASHLAAEPTRVVGSLAVFE